MTALYFAYGSNMSSTRLARRIEGAALAFVACLDGYRLTFDKPSRDGSGKANIAPDGSSAVWGVAWRLYDGAWPLLDRFEPGYERIACEVRDPDETLHEAAAYFYSGEPTDSPPFSWYVDHLLTGAREHGLPRAYSEQLADVLARSVGDVSESP